jgi:UDP-N-acetylmuramoylalanine-D-glutamate ligase
VIVLVCGGRDYSKASVVRATLDAIHAKTPVTLVIHGGATGADHLAWLWAGSKRIPSDSYPANWNAHGKAAGPIRNEAMLARNPDLVVAFPGGKGTAHMVRIAKAKGTKVLEVE